MYFGQEPIKDSIFQLIKLAGDHYYYGGTESVVKYLVKSNPYPIYRYLYSHRGTFTSVDLFLLNQYVLGIKLLVNYYTGWKIVDFNFGVCGGSFWMAWRVFLEGPEYHFGAILGVWAAWGRLLPLKGVLGDVSNSSG